MYPETLKQLCPSLQISGDIATLSLADVQKLALSVARTVKVDESWYLSQYPDVAEAIGKGEWRSATAHFRMRGFLEGRLPSAPSVDEEWYLKTYPDIAEALSAGRIESALAHYLTDGAREGRLPHNRNGESRRFLLRSRLPKFGLRQNSSEASPPTMSGEGI